jgi:hypothetical protein
MSHALLLTLAVGAPPEPTSPRTAPQVSSAEPDPALNAQFRTKDGWIGGDGAYSVSLPGGRSFWLFSDTWIGNIRDGKRRDATMVNNTVGVRSGTGADAKVEFFVQKSTDGKHSAIFTPPDGKGWFWLNAGHHADGKLHVFLPRIEKTAAGGAFGFKSVDLWLGSVSNPDAEPTKWKITYAKVPFSSFEEKQKVSFGSSVLTAGEHVYIYGYEELPGRPFPPRKLLVARVEKEKFTDFDSWRFLADGDWKPDMKSATGQAGGLGTEFSVSFVPGLKRYALVYTEKGLSERIVGRFATAPEGPWSEPVLLYTCPEMKKDRAVFTYAGKAHPHLAGDNELVISYASNSWELAPVINNAELYWPTFVRVKLK